MRRPFAQNILNYGKCFTLNIFRAAELHFYKNCRNMPQIPAYMPQIRQNLQFDDLHAQLFGAVYRIIRPAAGLSEIAHHHRAVFGHVSVARKHAISVVTFGKDALFVAMRHYIFIALLVGRRKIVGLPLVRYARHKFQIILQLKFKCNLGCNEIESPCHAA